MSPPDAAALAKMHGALAPILLDKIIPEYVAAAPGTPAYRANGLPMEAIVKSELPEKSKPTAALTSQFDKLLEYYQLAGIDDYSWKPVGPEMKTAEWSYLCFDPAEKKDDADGDRYRPVTLPAGSEDWASPAFDAAKAGWKTGKAPFGQKEGRQEALIASCTIPHCGCSIRPNALWDKEVLLMRGTFRMPKFEEGKRYRIVVGGAGHPWSGEGFALYLYGAQVAEMTGGYYKSNQAVAARGVHVFKDLRPEVEGKEVTLAVKAFLRQNGFRGKAAPPSGHISLWLEEATLPPALAAE